MSDIYKIGIGLTMTGNTGQFLAGLTRQLLGVHAHAKDLERTLTRIGSLKLAVGGALAVTGGLSIVVGLKKAVDHARELSHELATLKTFNLNASQIAQVQAAARATTRAVPGSTETGNTKLLAESYSMFGLKDAIKINPALARFAQITGARSGDYHKAEDDLYKMLRSGELMGKLVNHETHKVDPGKLVAFLDIAAKVQTMTAGKVNADTFLNLAQQGGPALANMSDEGLMGMLMASQGMGGARAGTALTSLYQQFVGGSMTQARAAELKRLGLVGDYTVGRGGHLTFAKGALDTDFVKALGKNPLEADALLKRAMESHGIRGIEKQTEELFRIIGRQTSQRLLSDFMRNMPQMISELARGKAAQGIDAQAETRNAEDLGTAEHNLTSAIDNLYTALGGPNASAAIGILNQITEFTNRITEVVRGMDPATLQAIGKGLLTFGLALTGAGAAALVAALGPLGWLTGAVVGGLAAWANQDFQGFKATMRSLRDLGLSVYQTARAYLTAPATIERVKSFYKLAYDTATYLRVLIKGELRDPNVFAGIRSSLKTTMDEVRWVQNWLVELGKWMSGQKFGPEARRGGTRDAIPGDERFQAPLFGIDWSGDIIGQIVTKLQADFVKGAKELSTQMTEFTNSFVTKIGAEITSWPNRLAEAISSMGTALVTAIGDKLRSLFSNPGNIPPIGSPTSYTGDGIGGMIHRASLGGANDNVGPAATSVPAGVAMTAAERNRLGLILKYESGGRNAMNYIGDRTHTAQGYYQITNTNWRRIAPLLGITAPNAMSATHEEQARVALYLLRNGGIGNWSNFNPALRRALGRGEIAPLGSSSPAPTAGAPPRERVIQINNVQHLDGEVIHRSTIRRTIQKSLHPRSTGESDDYGSWVHSGRTMSDVA